MIHPVTFRSVLSISAAVSFLFLLGCGGSQPPVGAPGAMPMHAEFVTGSNMHNLARKAADDGKYPLAPLIDVGGTLYGMTNNGGAFHGHKVCRGGCGTVFSMTTSGVVKVLHSFGHSQDGQYPDEAGLVDVGGTLYGTTSAGGALGGGTVFSITTDGLEKVLHSFGAQGDGADPIGGPLLEVRGKLYGTTRGGGTGDSGYRDNVRLRPDHQKRRNRTGHFCGLAGRKREGPLRQASVVACDFHRSG